MFLVGYQGLNVGSDFGYHLQLATFICLSSKTVCRCSVGHSQRSLPFCICGGFVQQLLTQPCATSLMADWQSVFSQLATFPAAGRCYSPVPGKKPNGPETEKQVMQALQSLGAQMMGNVKLPAGSAFPEKPVPQVQKTNLHVLWWFTWECLHQCHPGGQ